MRAILLRRLATAIPTLLAIILLSFVLMRAAPGSPFDGERPLDPITRATLDAAYGLDKPLTTQAALYSAKCCARISGRRWSTRISRSAI